MQLCSAVLVYVVVMSELHSLLVKYSLIRISPETPAGSLLFGEEGTM